MKRFILFTILALSSLFAYTQNGGNDFTFNPADIGFGNGDGFDGVIFSMVQQIDEKIIVGGDFTTYNGASRNCIARLNTDGSLDTSFDVGAGFDGSVNSAVIQSNGKIVVGGTFTSYNGTQSSNIARLNVDGSLDTSFDTGLGFDAFPVSNGVYSIAIQSNGKILASGGFSSYDGTTINQIARINIDGTLDTSFNPGTSLNGSFYSLVVQNNGKIVAAGNCWSCNGTAINHILRLNSDGTMDGSFSPGTGFNTSVKSLAVQSDGKILAGGWFTSFNGTPRNYIARLNTDGTLDNSFDPGSGFNNFVHSIAVQSDQKIITGGQFTSLNGTSANSIARLNTDGLLDNSFDIGTAFDTRVYSICIQSDGKILAGGDFNVYNGTSRKGIARLNIDGTLDIPFYPSTGFNDRVYSISVQNDGKVLVAGWFTSFNGTTRNRITRLNSDGTLDNSFDPGTGFNYRANSIAVQNDGKILVGGEFTVFNGMPTNYLVRLNTDGTLDNSFVSGSGFNSPVRSVIVQNDGKILVGGQFTSINGTARNRIARLNADGTHDTTFDPGTGFNGFVYSLAIQSDNKILVGGDFSSSNGISRNSIVRLNIDGSVDASFDPGTGFNNRVNSIALQNDGKIIAGGFFTSFNGATQNKITRLNVDGTNDISFNSGSGFSNDVYSVAIQNDQKIIVGGGFTSYNGVQRNNITRINNDGSHDNSFNIGTGFDHLVLTLAVQSDNKIITGGRFTSYNGIGRNRIARLLGGCVDVSLSTEWSTITANNTDATYQWIDCSNNNAIIPNENSQVFIATQDGYYAVIVSSTISSCVDTSDCINITSASLEESFIDNSLHLYPNPNNGSFTIETSGPFIVEIFNSVGRKIDVKELETGKNQFSIDNIESGIYFLHAIDDFGERTSHRIVITE